MNDVNGDRERPVRVALSNDYEIALLGLASMLAPYAATVQIVDLTTNPRMAHEPDVILFDTFGRLPDEDVKLRLVVKENAPAKVVVYSWDPYPEETARRAGAAAYLHKSLGAAELVEAIVAIHEDRTPPATRGGGGVELTWPAQASGLTEREAEMLTFIVRGLTNEEIARRSYLSVNTVKTHIRSAYRKIGVQSRSQAVAWGFRHGLDSTDDTGV